MTKQNTTSTDKSRLFYWLAVAATFAAVLVHGYLAREHFNLRFGQVGASLCNFNETFNCATVSASRYSEFLGIPMAIWGAFVNLALLFLILWYPLTEDEKKPAARRNLVLLSIVIAVTSVVMGVISAVVIGKYCPFCMLAYLLSFLTLAGVWFGFPTYSRKQSQAAPGAKGFVPLIVLLLIAAFGARITTDQVTKSYGGGDNLDYMVQSRVQGWEGAPTSTVNSIDPLVLGAEAANAKMTIVEFADFRCGHCKHASPVLKAFVRAHPDVRLEFMAWPLDGECNTAMDRANGASCLLARTVMCGEKIAGKGWETHDRVFDLQDRFATVEAVRGLLPDIASSIGIDKAQLEACTQGQEAKSLVERQTAVGTALQLQGTPTLYINGKALPGGGPSVPILNEIYKRIVK